MLRSRARKSGTQTSHYRGVSLLKQTGKWHAQINVGGKQVRMLFPSRQHPHPDLVHFCCVCGQITARQHSHAHAPLRQGTAGLVFLSLMLKVPEVALRRIAQARAP